MANVLRARQRRNALLTAKGTTTNRYGCGIHRGNTQADGPVLGRDTDFDRAWAEGAALSTEEAIAYAQRGRG